MTEAGMAMSSLSEFRQRKVDAAVQSSPGGAPAPLPGGTVTFLLTDIEGSTRTWEDREGEMTDAVARHYEILDAAVAEHQGVRPLEQGEGDSLVAVTTHFKMGDIKRHVSFSSDRATFTSRFTRYGDLLTVTAILEDPVYLAKPAQWSGKWEYRPAMRHSNQKCDIEVARKFLQQ